eukprot:TRINITY_DN11491_c0_g1_i1.p1 TRINITY_DN11491_c0_g1~~TRINITY_DN11491_c0_g1_i1.p1  ORF type:complete len:608 (-),score=98.08 TRINITY_DN11491_c0_g1_i1:383-2206(-)
MGKSDKEDGKTPSLAEWSGMSTKVIITLMIVTCHALFAYAQIFAPLLRVNLDVTTDYHVQQGILAKIVDAIDENLCQEDNETASFDCETQQPNALCEFIRCGSFNASQVQTEDTYLESMHELWNYDGPFWTRVGVMFSTAILVLTSFIWPHVKLGLLHWYFYRPMHAWKRREAYYWGALFGKWSFFDVVAMCALVGVFQVSVSMDYTNDEGTGLLDFLMQSIGDICYEGKLFASSSCPADAPGIGQCCESEIQKLWWGLRYGKRKLCDVLCNTIWHKLNYAERHELEGQITGSVYVQGLAGMYSFCIAVVFSLVIGMVLDSLDQRYRRCGEAFWADELDHEARSIQPVEAGLEVEAADGAEDDDDEEDSDLSNESDSDLEGMSGVRRCLRATVPVVMLLVAIATLIAVLPLPIFTRRVSGTLPDTLSVLYPNITLDRTYSLPGLAEVTRENGGNLLYVTFMMFVIVGAFVRLGSLLIGILIPVSEDGPSGSLKLLASFSRHASAFYAVELMILAVPLLNLTFGPTSAKSLDPKDFKPCGWIQNATNTTGRPCMEVGVEMASGYWVMVASFVAFVLTGYNGSIIHVLWHRRMEPGDTLPPLLCKRKAD